ncbi:MAG: hypothetical protein QF535_23175, partial [Anaerolineales bacterium]|nr:hypothetical protein [Anaerolineales bacterium]
HRGTHTHIPTHNDPTNGLWTTAHHRPYTAVINTRTAPHLVRDWMTPTASVPSLHYPIIQRDPNQRKTPIKQFNHYKLQYNNYSKL